MTKHKPFVQIEDFSNVLYGKVPPQALPAEEAVLGAIMLDKNALYQIRNIITSKDDFYSEQHQHVYEAILSLDDRQKPIDMLTVMEELKKIGTLEQAGGPAHLASLTNKVASAANIEFHAMIVKQKAIRRQAIKAGSKIVSMGFDDSNDDLEIINLMEQEFMILTQDIGMGDTSTASGIAKEIVKNQLAFLKSDSNIAGIPTGFTDFDELTGGLIKGELYIIAARPGMGKSSWATTAIYNISKLGIPVGLFTLEMSKEQQVHRLLSIESAVPNKKVINPKLRDAADNYAFDEAVKKISELPVFINDRGGVALEMLRTEARRMVLKNKVQVIFIDYLQLMSTLGYNHNREAEVSTISRGLKALAKELNIPIVALSQLSRDVEKRGGAKRPVLSDLRESGSLEQDAYLVAFLYRPFYYGIKEDEFGNSTEKLCELIVSKHRNGELRDIYLRFSFRTSSFQDWQENDNFSKFVIESTGGSADEDLPF